VENEGLFYEPVAGLDRSHINPFHTHAPLFFKIPFCIILPHMLHLSVRLFLLHYLVKILYASSGPAQDVGTADWLMIWHPMQANNLVHHRTDFFKLFHPKTGLVDVCEGECQKCR
jgi:hypothetical protein